MEDKSLEMDIIIPAWAVMTQRIVQQQIQTPQGIQIVQQPINIPIIFRGLKEVQKYVEEQYETADQIVLQRIEYPISQENELEFYYK